MLRAFSIAVAIGLMIGSVPAFAQNSKGSCQDWCFKNRCAPGNTPVTHLIV